MSGPRTTPGSDHGGGLDVVKNWRALRNTCRKLNKLGIEVSLFVNPERTK
ncbi:MAG: pyridoxine 5'-phosphate synthase [Verrucomicrobiota bacterium]